MCVIYIRESSSILRDIPLYPGKSSILRDIPPQEVCPCSLIGVSL